MKLNPQQQKAVNSDNKHILVIAGPGTGKTSVLTNRIARLLTSGISGHNILALTFTNKAAREMRERIAELADEMEIRKIWIGTFHSVALRMLSEYGECLEYKKDITVYDDYDQKDILTNLIKEKYLKITPKEALRLLHHYYSNFEVKADNKEFEGLLTSYKYFLKSNNALDFGMILVEVNRLLTEHPEVQQHYQQKFTYCLVDEYQDTDRTQYKLHTLIGSDNLFVVGDADQSVYGWRGSSIDIILNFEKECPNTEVIKLEHNYRSTIPIVEASNALISHNTERFEKNIWTDKKGKAVLYSSDEIDWADEIRAGVKHQKDDPFGAFTWDRYAVLARTRALLTPLAEAFDKAKIPYQMTGRHKDMFDKYEVRQFIRVLKLVHNPDNNYLCRMVLNWPERRFTELEVEQAKLRATENDCSLMEVIKNTNAGKIFNELLSFTEETKNNTALISRLIEIKLNIVQSNSFTEFTEYVHNWRDEQLESNEPVSLEAFLKHLALKDIQDDIKEKKDAVTLSTIHGAKGLEWPVVIIIGAEEGLLPMVRKDSDIEEERRLMYVAMTRAKDILYITYCKKREASWGGQVMKREKSRFIEEMEGQRTGVGDQRAGVV